MMEIEKEESEYQWRIEDPDSIMTCEQHPIINYVGAAGVIKTSIRNFLH